MLKLVGIVVFFLVFKGVSLTNAAELRIGVTYLSAPNPSLSIIQKTTDYLNTHLVDGVRLQFYEIRELEEAIRKHEVDLVLSGAGFYRRLHDHGLRILATLVTDRGPDPDLSNGSAMIVLASRSDLKTLEDLRGKTLAATVANGFQGYQIGMGEIAKIESHPFKFFGRTLFVGESSGLDMRQVVDAVLDGRADVGFVKTCYIEDILTAGTLPQKLRILNARLGLPLSCLSSTELYPNWSISSMSTLSHELRREITALLLQMPEEQGGTYWTVAGDYRSVDELYRRLKLGPYEHLNDWTLLRIWREFSWPIVLLIGALVGLVLHVMRSDALIERRTKELNEMFAEKEQLAEKNKAFEDAMDRMQRVGIIGQLSTLFAHELSQPLNNVACYAHGLMKVFTNVNGGVTIDNVKGVIETPLKTISYEAERAAQIVEKVRHFAKPQASERVHSSFVRVVADAVEEFKGAKAIEITITDESQGVMVQIDPMAIRLAILNLIRNAQQAVETANRLPVVTIQVGQIKKGNHNFVFARIRDNGPRIDDETFAQMQTPLFTTKREGLGLGLPLVHSIAERYGGWLKIRCWGDDGVGGLEAEFVITCEPEERDYVETGTSTTD